MTRRIPFYRTLPLLLAVILLALAPRGTARAAQQGISPDLEVVLAAAAPDQLVPVIIVMAEQADVNGLLPAARLLDRAGRRAFARRELTRIAETTQTRVRARLDAARGQGADRVRLLWLGNSVAARVTPAIVREIAGYPEVRTVLWDPPIPHEQAEDLVGASGAAPASGPDAGTAGVTTIVWHLNSVNAPAAWLMGFRGQGMVVAVLDSGVDRNHPDLADHIWSNPGETPANGIDDDLNGFVDDTWGWDFAANDNSPIPNAANEAHGTYCAGCVAGDGTAGNATGVAPDALIMACKVNTWSENIDGIQYAIENGADVITMSRTEKWRFSPKPDYDWWRSNTDAELLAGIFHANSIGNEGDNTNTDPIPFNIAAPGNSPSPWRHPAQVQAGVSGIVGCGAVDQNNLLATFSSLGPAAWEDFTAHWPAYTYPVRPEYQDYPWWGGQPGLLKPDVMAPGVNTMTTTYPGNGYITVSGTSTATPLVAGVMVLVAQANPDLSAEEMSMILQTTATDLGPAGKDNQYGAGLVNAVQAIIAAQQLHTTGWVRGTVFSGLGSELPVPGVLVEVVGEADSTTTNGDGFYQMELSNGLYTLRFSHPQYYPVEVPVTISGGQIEQVDVDLGAPVADVSGGYALRLILEQNRPNPSRPATAIRFTLPREGAILLEVFDVQGRLVRGLVRETLPAGQHTAAWDGRDGGGVAVPSGLYFCRLSADGEILSRRMAVMR